MLFIGLFLFLAISALNHYFLRFIIPVFGDLPIIIQSIIIFVISVLLAYLLTYVSEIYIPSLRASLARAVSLTRIRWLAAIGFIIAVISLSYCILFHLKLPGSYMLTLLLAIAAVSIVNALGIELRNKRLSKKVVLLPDNQAYIIPKIPQFEPIPDTNGNDPDPLIPDTDKPPETVPGGDDSVTPDATEPDTIPDQTQIPDSGTISKTYEWMYINKSYSIDLKISKAMYEELSSQLRVQRVSKWADAYISNGVTSEIRELVLKLMEKKIGFGSYDEVSFVLSFVQSIITYKHDNGEYPKYPLETLFDETGDCEDFSILGAALLKGMGYDVALLIMPTHAALGVAGADDLPGTYVTHEGVNYYYCEMTATGWKIGKIPDDHKSDSIDVSPVKNPPPKVVIPDEPV